MELIKKLVIPMIGLVAVGTSVMAAEYKVGDKMPDFSRGRAMDQSIWYNSDMSKKGKQIQYDLDGDNISDVVVAHRDCGEYKIIFGFYDFNSKKLYLDNKPHDGKIDQVIKDVIDRKVWDDAPACEQEQKPTSILT